MSLFPAIDRLRKLERCSFEMELARSEIFEFGSIPCEHAVICSLIANSLSGTQDCLEILVPLQLFSYQAATFLCVTFGSRHEHASEQEEVKFGAGRFQEKSKNRRRLEGPCSGLAPRASEAV